MNKVLKVSSVLDIFISESGIFFQMIIIGFILPRLFEMEIINPQLKNLLDLLLGRDTTTCDSLDNFSIKKLAIIWLVVLIAASLSKTNLANSLSDIQEQQDSKINKIIDDVDLISYENSHAFRSFLHEKRYKILVAQKEELNFLWGQIAQFLYCVLFAQIFFANIFYALLVTPVFLIESLIHEFFLYKQKIEFKESVRSLVQKRDLDALMLFYNSCCEGNLYSKNPISLKQLNNLKTAQQILKLLYIAIFISICKFIFQETEPQVRFFLKYFLYIY